MTTPNQLVTTPKSTASCSTEQLSLGELAKETYSRHLLANKTELETVLNTKDNASELVEFLDTLSRGAWQAAAEAVYTVAIQQASENICNALLKNMEGKK